LPFDLPQRSTVFGDSGFTDYEFEDFMAQQELIKMMITRKKGSLRGDDFTNSEVMILPIGLLKSISERP
jgi:hypothetical protein